jgi:phosphomannomutase
MLAALHAIAALGSAPAGTTLSELLGPFERYVASGEINSTVADAAAATARVRADFEGEPGVLLDDLDGLTVSGADWWFNVRPSNTEPLLRLNAEAPDAAALAVLRDRVLRVIREQEEPAP